MSKSAFVFYVILSSSLAQKQGTEISENFPNNYPNSLDKNYTIKADDTFVIEFSSFDLEDHSTCLYDWVMIIDGDGSVLMPSKCGSEIPAPVTTNTNTAVVIFHSDHSVNKPGFRLQWKTVASVKSGIIITGGYDAATGSLTGSTSSELFNPSTGKTCFIEHLPEPKYGHSLDQLGDGSLVACGGYLSSSAKNCVRFEGSAPHGVWTDYSTLVNKRYWHTSFVSQGQILLMGGGVKYKWSTTELVKEGEKYKLQRSTVRACGINDGSSVIVTGGYYVLKTVSRYNLEGFIENMPTLITGRYDHGCGLFINQDNTKIYVVAGGYTGSTPYLRSTELLSVAASAWEAGQDLPDRGLAYVASVSLSRAVVIMGGYCSSKECPETGRYRAEIISFNGTWNNVGTLKVPRRDHAASVFTVPKEMDITECN